MHDTHEVCVETGEQETAMGRPGFVTVISTNGGCPSGR